MQQLLQQAQKMQQDLAKAQEELARTEVEGQAGGGLVKATVTGSGELRALQIDPKAVDPEDTETLADLILAAVHAANENAQNLQQQKLGPLAQGLGGGGIPGLPFYDSPRTSTVPSDVTPGRTAVRCTKAWYRTSSTSWAGCPASVPRAPSGSPSTSSRPNRPTSAVSPTR